MNPDQSGWSDQNPSKASDTAKNQPFHCSAPDHEHMSRLSIDWRIGAFIDLWRIEAALHPQQP